MRVIGGKHKGCKLLSFQGDEIRPTADRVKENVFNILSKRIAGAVFLDLFCGTGGMGAEALSRGAARCVFVDERRESLELAKKNLAKIKETSAEFVLSDSIRYLERVKEKFDIIYVDPPYKSGLGIAALNAAVSNGALAENGIIIFESERHFTQTVDGLILSDERKYGRVYISIFGLCENKNRENLI